MTDKAEVLESTVSGGDLSLFTCSQNTTFCLYLNSVEEDVYQTLISWIILCAFILLLGKLPSDYYRKLWGSEGHWQFNWDLGILISYFATWLYEFCLVTLIYLWSRKYCDFDLNWLLLIRVHEEINDQI